MDFRPDQTLLHSFRYSSPFLYSTFSPQHITILVSSVKKTQVGEGVALPASQSLVTPCVGVILINTQTEIIKTYQGIWLLPYVLILMIIEYLGTLHRLYSSAPGFPIPVHSILKCCLFRA